MAKSKEWSQKLREEIIALHKQGTGYQKIAKALYIPRETVGSIVCNFKVKWTVVTYYLGEAEKGSYPRQQPDF